MKLVSAITRRLVIIIPYLWLFIFFLVPFGIVLKISLSEPMMAMPPYAPTIDLADGFSGIVEAFRQFSLDRKSVV